MIDFSSSPCALEKQHLIFVVFLLLLLLLLHMILCLHAQLAILVDYTIRFLVLSCMLLKVLLAEAGFVLMSDRRLGNERSDSASLISPP